MTLDIRTLEIPAELDTPARLLLGPGPSPVHPRVMRAMLSPVLGHLDPDFLKIMQETAALLRGVFETGNALTLAVSGTGTAGMEAAVVNCVQPGDRVVVGVAGYFGDRLAQICRRCGAEVVTIDVPWGDVISPARLAEVLITHGPVRLVALVHAETSTGARQSIPEMAALAHRHGALLLVDAVTSLGGCEVKVDEWDIDICYSGSQKCLGAPPGLAPITVGERALEQLRDRPSKVPSFYLDLGLLQSYWSSTPTYHHTASSSMVYALREALRLVHEEGLAARYARHERNACALWAGLEAMGLQMHAPAEHRLATLTTVRIPSGIDDAKVRRALLNEYNIEIGGGLGPLRGEVWRIGLMGYGSNASNVSLLLAALESLLRREGYDVPSGAGQAAASAVFGTTPS